MEKKRTQDPFARFRPLLGDPTSNRTPIGARAIVLAVVFAYLAGGAFALGVRSVPEEPSFELRAPPVVSPPPAEVAAEPKPFAWPTQVREVTSRFFVRRGAHRRHYGIDIRARGGDPIVAAADGQVSYAGPAAGYGKLVVVKHADGFESRYAHASRVAVRNGQTVHQGQLLARAGRTGNATGVHCHFEIRRSGVPLDPMAFLR